MQVHRFGKLVSGAASAVEQPSGHLLSPRLFVKDSKNHILFLIDTGSDVSVIPKKFAPNPEISVKYNLNAVNNSPITTYGIKELFIDLNLGEIHRWNLIVADVTTPILGADFLTAHHLLPDLKLKKLVNGINLCSVKCLTKSFVQNSVHLVTADINSNLVSKFPSVFKPPQYQKNPPHSVQHQIITTGLPIYEKPRRLHPQQHDIVKKTFNDMVNLGICQPSNSDWASPLVIINKQTKVRIAGDYRKLNNQTVPDRYPLPNLHDSTQRLAGKCTFSTIDLIRAFHNIPIFPDHKSKTAVISPIGLYEYNRMPFGLRNAPSTFQRFMDTVLKDLNFVFCYIDDILVFSNDNEEHLNHLNLLFERLEKFGLSINAEKCSFFREEVNFLGHHISPSGFRPTEEKIEFFKTLSPPTTISGLRSILGIFNFYRRFNKNASKYLAPLNDLLKGHTKKKDKSQIAWNSNLKADFEKCRESFINFTLLTFPNENAELLLTTDASGTAVGAVLEQIINNEKQPLGFFSKKLDETKQKYSTYDRELYAVYLAIEHFEYFLEGRDFTIATDHKPLVHIFTTNKRSKLERRARHIEYISQFTNKIIHISGSSNLIADRLSRPEINAINSQHSIITSNTISDFQKQDPEIENIKNQGYRDHIIQEIFFENSEKNSELKPLLCSFFNNVNRPLVPKQLRQPIFTQIHNLAHTGLKSTLKLIRSKFFWPQMTTDIKLWCKTCIQCQKCKITRHTKSQLCSFPSSDRFEHVHLDIVGPLPNSQGFRYLCTFIDRATSWIEAIPLQGITAEQVALTFMENWVSRFGTPLKLTTDRGAQFRSDLFNELCKFIGTLHISTTAYHPQSNGMVERFHRILKASIKCTQKSWTACLPTVLLGLRTAPRDEKGISCAEMTFGTQLRLPGEFYTSSEKIADGSEFVAQLRRTFQAIGPRTRSDKPSNKIFIPKDLESCDRVFVRVDRVKSPLEAPYCGPFTVIKRNKKFFTLDIKDKHDTVSIDRLKPAFELNSQIDVTPSFNIKLKADRPSFFSLLPFNTVDVQPTPSNAPNSPPLAPTTAKSSVTTSKKMPVNKKVRFSEPRQSSKGRLIKRPKKFL